MKSTSSHFPLVALFAGAVAISLAPILVRLSDVDPVAKAFWRLFLSLPLVWAGVLLSTKRNRTAPLPQSRSDYGAMAVAGLFFTADLSVWHWSLRFTTVANATLLPNLAPIFVVLGSRFILKERVRLLFIAGMAIAIVGMLMMVGTSYRLNRIHFWGDVMGLATAFFYAGYLISIKRLRDRFSTTAVLAYSGVASAASLFLISLLMHERIVPRSWQGWLVLIALAVISHVGGQGLITYALAHLKASFSSVGLLLQPMLAAILAWVLFKETLTPFQATGGVLLLSGILTAKKASG